MTILIQNKNAIRHKEKYFSEKNESNISAVFLIKKKTKQMQNETTLDVIFN